MSLSSAIASKVDHSFLTRMSHRVLPYKLAFLCSLSIMILELEASRLVARHVGSSLAVWTSVIGIMLAGICLGNALGGRLADKASPRRLIGPMLGLGAAMTIISLLVNDFAGPSISAMDSLGFNVRALILISLDFLIPTTMLGMISPIVAKMAVEQATRKGSAIGLIYFVGAVGSIVGTFIAGYYLIFVAPTSTIVALVAGMLALLCLYVAWDTKQLRILALLTVILIGLGTTASIARLLGSERALPLLLSVFGPIGSEVATFGGVGLSVPMIGGYLSCLVLGIASAINLRFVLKQGLDETTPQSLSLNLNEVAPPPPAEHVILWDLALMSFLASLAFMAFEMVAGRLVSRHLGSSIYGWTTVIGVLLGGLSLGNFFGGWLSNFTTKKSLPAFFFMLCSITILASLVLESPANLLMEKVEWFRDHSPFLSDAIVMTGYPWWQRVLYVVTVCFLPASIALGTLSPMLAKMAIDRSTAAGQVGRSIGVVYSWGMVGSILGTFLTGFFLIDIFGTKVMLLVISASMAACGAVLGGILQSAWAGLPLGLCVIALVPTDWFQTQALKLGLREPVGLPTAQEEPLAWLDESQYYYIKVNNEPEGDSQKRTIVLDNLIHGYFILGHPERLDYDYEHIYALVAQRVAEAKTASAGKKDVKEADLSTLFLGGGAYTFPRYMQYNYPRTLCDVAEIDPAVLKANHAAMGLPKETPTIQTTIGDARQFVLKNQGVKKYDLIFGDAFNDFSVPWHLTTREFNDKLANLMSENGVYMINIIDVYESDKTARETAKRNNLNEETELNRAKKLGGFLSSWVKTARQTFPHIYVYGTESEPGEGERETFVVVVSKNPVDLKDLGKRPTDPKFEKMNSVGQFQPEPFPELNMNELNVRARGIILTDDYAPVENLLAPVAATRGDE